MRSSEGLGAGLRSNGRGGVTVLLFAVHEGSGGSMDATIFWRLLAPIISVVTGFIFNAALADCRRVVVDCAVSAEMVV